MHKRSSYFLTNLDELVKPQREILLTGNSSLIPHPKSQNISNLSKYSSLSLLPLTLFNYFATPLALWFLLVSIVQLSLPDLQSYNTIFPLIFFTFFRLFKKFSIFCKSYSRERDLQNQEYLVWKSVCFACVARKDLNPGDIILLKELDEVPADLLLIASGNIEKSCYVDVTKVTGEMNFQKKEAVKEVQSLIDSLDVNEAGFYLNTIDGKVNVDEPVSAFDELIGKIKIRNSPKSVTFRINNVLLQGSIIKASTWIFGLVLYVGKDTKIALTGKKTSKKITKSEKEINKIALVFCVCIGVFVLLHFFFAIFLSEEGKNPTTFFSFFVLYSYALPFPLLFILELGKWVISFRISYYSPGIIIKDSQVLEDLGQIEYILLEKNENLTDNTSAIKVCYIDYTLYLLDAVPNQDPPEETSFIMTEADAAMELIKKLVDEKNIEAFNFARSLAICNSAYPQEAESFITSNLEDKLIVSAAAGMGLVLSYRDSKKLILSYQEVELEFVIIAVKDSTAYAKKCRMLLQSLEDKSFIYFVRGPLDTMIEWVNHSATSQIEGLRMRMPGIRIIVFTSRVLTERQAQEFKYSYNNAKRCPVNKEGRIEGVFDEYEKELNLLGFIGTEDKISGPTKKTIDFLNTAGVKTWIASGDCEENTISTGLGSGIIDTTSEILRLCNAESTEEIEFLLQDALKNKVFFADQYKLSSEIASIDGISQRDDPEYQSSRSFYDKRRDSEKSLGLLRRTSLHPLLSRISNHKSLTNLCLNRAYNPDGIDYSLVMDGDSLELALTTEDTLKLLALVLFLAKSVCFFNMKPNQKKILGSILKNCYKFNPVYMSIGGVSDLGLSSEANIGVGPESDIKISEFSELKELLLCYGLNSYRNIGKVTMLCIYSNILMIVPIVIYHYFCNYSATWLVFPENSIIYILCFQVIVLVPILIYDHNIDPIVACARSQIYSAGLQNNTYSLLKVLDYCIPAVISGGLTFTFAYLIFSSLINSNGMTEDRSLLNIYLFITISITLQCVAFIDTSMISYYIIGSHLAFDIALASYLAISDNISIHVLFSCSYLFFSSPLLVVSCVANIAANFTVFYTGKCWNLLFNPDLLERLKVTAFNSFMSIPNKVGQFENNLESVYLPNKIPNNMKKQEDYAIHPILLKFKSEAKEEDYNTGKAKMYYKNYRIYMTIYSLFHIGIFLFDALDQSKNLPSKILLLISSGILFLSLFFQFFTVYNNYTFRYMSIFYIVCQVFTVFSIVLLYESFSISFIMYPLLFFVSFTHWWILIVLGSLIAIPVDVFYKSFIFSSFETYMLFEYAIVLCSICTISAYATYNLEYTKRKEFIMVSNVSNEMEKATNVLELLLPEFVISRVKDGVRYISEDQGIVSVLFCNICDFEEIISDLAPHELTGFLDELFSKFDQLCEMVGVTKIETVGKTYMASAGLRDSEAELDPLLSKVNHARRVVELGFGMIRVIQKFVVKGMRIHIKIGINSGPVRAGVVGYHKPQFSLVGDTVNTSSRMAATLKEYDSIQITTETYELIKDHSDLHFFSQSSYVKGKGDMDTFIVSVKIPSENVSIDNFSPAKEQPPGTRYHNLSVGFLNSFSSLPGATSSDTISIRNRSKKQTLMNIQWKESLFFQSKASDVIDTVKFFSCSLTETKKEEKFRHRALNTNYQTVLSGIVVSLLANFLLLVVELAYLVIYERKVTSINLWILVTQLIFFSFLCATLRQKYLSIYYGVFIQLVYFYPIPLLILSDYFDTKQNIALTSLRVSFQVLLLTQCSTLLFKHLSICSFAVLLGWTIYTIIAPSSISSTCFAFIIVSLITVYHKEIKMRVYSNLMSTGEKELKKVEQLLIQMVPAHAYEHLKQECSVIDKFSQVTLLYADIVGFTAWSAEKTPDEVVTMLNNMFTRFDKMCVEHSVYKVHTIGDCYVAMSYIGAKNRDPGEECLHILQFAISMIQTIEEVNQENSMGISMRIGVHTGDVVAGITGKNIVRYDIYGNDVYIANSMESNGKSGYIAVSTTTMNIIKAFRPSMFKFEEHKNVEIFGTDIQIYLLRY